jgi:hypothetical protein
MRPATNKNFGFEVLTSVTVLINVALDLTPFVWWKITKVSEDTSVFPSAE